jgi:hypothetical protein
VTAVLFYTSVPSLTLAVLSSRTCEGKLAELPLQ